MKSSKKFYLNLRNNDSDQIFKENLKPKKIKMKKNWIMERKRSSGVRRIFTIAFLTFLAPDPVRQTS